MMPKLLRHRNILLIIAGAVLMTLLAYFLIQPENYIAKVGDTVIKEELIDDYSEKVLKFRDELGDPIEEELVIKDVVDTLIDEQIIRDYAAEIGIEVTDDELNDYYQTKVDSAESEEALLSELIRLYGFDKQYYQEVVLKNDLLRDRVQNHIKKPLSGWLEEQKEELGVDINL